MNLPKVINVAGVEYKVELLKDDVHSEDDYGRVSFQSRTIIVHDQKDSTLNWQTFMHELLHVLSHHFHLELDINEKRHSHMDVLATSLVDTLVRSGLLNVKESSS